jgi:hypothetical protein
MQFTTDWLRPTRVAQDDSVGTTEWVETDALFTGDSYTFSFFNAGAETAYLDQARLVFNDAITGANEASGTDTSPFANLGGVTDLWGESSLAGSDINNLKFGVAIATGTADFGVPSGVPESYYLIATGFEGLYAIPDDATIEGIELQLDGAMQSTGGGTQTYQLVSLLIRVTYSWDVNVDGEASSFGGIFIDPPNRQLPQKKFRAKVRSEAGDYLGDWRDLSIDPNYKQDINNIIGSMPVSFARNYLSTETSVETLLNEDGTVLTDESDSPFLIDTSPVAALGEGTNLDTNFNVEVDAIYGQFEPLLNEDDTPILNEDGSMLLIEEGFPLGRTIFRGYVPRWELPLSGKGIKAEIRSYSQDLANILLETEDTPYMTYNTLTDNSIGIMGGGPTDYTALGQSFVTAADKAYSKVRLYPFAGWYTDVEFTVTIRGGTPVAPTGVTYGSGTGVVNRNTPVEYLDVVFDEVIELPAGTYYFDFDTGFAKTGGNVTYPLNFKLASGNTNGILRYILGGGSWTSLASGEDIAYVLYEAGAETTVPYLSQDPSDILRSIIDFARGRGAEVNYTEDSIQDTGTTVSYTFRGQTVKEAIEKVLELAPAGWYFYYDFGTDTLYFKERSATPDRWLRPDTVVDGKIIKTIEQVINDVPFSGGGDPALYVRDRRTPATGTRRGLKKLSDNRVTSEATAYILTGSEIDQLNQALYAGDVEITEDGTFYLEDVAVGEMLGFIGFGSLVDAIVVQSVSKDYKPDSMPLTLTYNIPRVNKRVEDIKRNLDALETANNPTEPS